MFAGMLHENGGVLPVGLEGDTVIARHLTEVLLQLFKENLVAISLIQRHEGVDVGKLAPGDWLKGEGTAVSGKDCNLSQDKNPVKPGSEFKRKNGRRQWKEWHR